MKEKKKFKIIDISNQKIYLIGALLMIFVTETFYFIKIIQDKNRNYIKNEYRLKNKITKLDETILKLNNKNTELNNKNTELNNKNTELNNKNVEIKQKSLVQFSKNDLMNDILKYYSGTSIRVKKIIIKTILEESKKYNINPLILYSLIHTESSMRYWKEHLPKKITINKKKITIKAVGLGGVVWEWHKDDLIKEKIALVRSDLFDPAINIRASAYIYNKFFHQKKHPKAKTQDASAMIRYFGGGYQSYFNKINKHIGRLISEKMYRKDVNKNEQK